MPQTERTKNKIDYKPERQGPMGLNKSHDSQKSVSHEEVQPAVEKMLICYPAFEGDFAWIYVTESMFCLNRPTSAPNSVIRYD